MYLSSGILRLLIFRERPDHYPGYDDLGDPDNGNHLGNLHFYPAHVPSDFLDRRPDIAVTGFQGPDPLPVHGLLFFDFVDLQGYPHSDPALSLSHFPFVSQLFRL